MNETRVHAYIQSQIGKLACEIEWWIQINKEDFMHDINQCEFKMDGQDEGRDDREASFKWLRKLQLGGEQGNRYRSKTGDQRVMESSMLKSVIT